MFSRFFLKLIYGCLKYINFMLNNVDSLAQCILGIGEVSNSYDNFNLNNL